MPSIFYGKGSYRRQHGNLPELTLVNMFLEAAPVAESGAILIDRRGLETHSTLNAGPSVPGVWSQAGTFGGDIFSVSNSTLYRNTTSLGAVVGTGPVSFAGTASEVLVTAGASLYSYNGTNLVAVTFPDSANVRAVTFISGHFVAVRDGTQKYYWSAQLDGRSWDALDFASAESEPDNLLDAVAMRGNLYLMGQATIEPWFYTGDLNLPFSLIQQRLFPKGVIATGCTVEMDNALLFIANDGMVYRTSDVPERLSDHGIEERISNSTTWAAFGFIHEGHSFFNVRLDTGTWAIDMATGQWCEFQSHGRANFAGRCAAMQGTTVLFGDDASGNIWTFGEESHDDGVELLREFTAAFPLKGGATMVDSIAIDAATGHTTLLVGQGSDPIIEMAPSRDAGTTWGTFRTARLGAQGEYRTRTRWLRCGQFDEPGAMFKFRVTDPVSLRITNVAINEPAGGRSRAS